MSRLWDYFQDLLPFLQLLCFCVYGKTSLELEWPHSAYIPIAAPLGKIFIIPAAFNCLVNLCNQVL